VDACRDRTACVYQRGYVFLFLCFATFLLLLFILGQQLLYQLYLFNKKSFAHLGFYAGVFGSSALLAFSLEFSEFLLVSNTSSLTLSVSGIFKVKFGFYFIQFKEFKVFSFQEIVMLYLAVEYNGNKLNTINIVGLAICLTGIVIHCIQKFYTLQSTIKNTI
jgi:hypothetical protein